MSFTKLHAMQVHVRSGSNSISVMFRGELRSGACVKWRGQWRHVKKFASADALSELTRRVEAINQQSTDAT